MMEVYASTYERYLVGYKLTLNRNSNSEATELKSEEKSEDNVICTKLELQFRIHSAASSLRCVSTNGSVLACGSSDEAIYLYDVTSRRELGPVRFHSATVNCIDFFQKRLMVSGAEDGSVCVWDCSGLTFSLLKQFRLTKAVLSVSVEPTSGRVALTTDAGGYVKVWDLCSCVLAYSMPVKWKPHTVLWPPLLKSKSSSGNNETESKIDRFAILGDKILDVKSLNDGQTIASFKIDNCGLLTCAKFVTDKLLVVSTDAGHLILVSLEDNKTIELRNAHNSRIKGLSVQPNDEQLNKFTVFSGSSDGFIKVWTSDVAKEPLDLCFVTLVNVKCRITSLTSASIQE